MLIAIVLAFVFFPALLVLGFLAYTEFEKNAGELLAFLRHPLGPYIAGPPPGPMPYYPPQR
jgi:hypothetical protein